MHGNASLEKTTNNALSVLAAIGKEDQISVHPGASHALVVSFLRTLASLPAPPPPGPEALGLTGPVRGGRIFCLRCLYEDVLNS